MISKRPSKRVRDESQLYARHCQREAIEAMLSGDLDTGGTILRDYINAKVGFDE